MQRRNPKFVDHFSPAEMGYSNYAYQHRGTLLSGRGRSSEECPGCDASSAAHIAEEVEQSAEERRFRRLATIASTLASTISSRRRNAMVSNTTTPAEGVRSEEIILMQQLLKEIAKDLPEDCEREWQQAFEICRKELNKTNPNRGITGGHKTLQGCAKGLVSDRCGGNAVPIVRQ